MKLEFYGAAGGVTGSHMVLDTRDFRIGIDAGLFQGSDTDRNQDGFGHDPNRLKAMLLTHAHVDHSGRIPLLIKKGFRGLVYSTDATRDLCQLMLQDSAHLMEESAERERRHAREMKRPPRPPLYTKEDAERAVGQFKSVDYSKKFKLEDISVRFSDAGHILGSTIIEMDIGKKRLVFSGDLGRPDTPILRDPQRVDEADWLVLESTYGDMDHERMPDRGKRLMEIVSETVQEGGNVIIPAFAIGRTQEILYELNPFAEAGKLSGVKCFVDSPMAISASEIYRRHPECFDQETLALIKRGDSPLEFPGMEYARSRESSKAINELKEPHIVISASGMCTGGRVLHHLMQNIERKESTILCVGYQADGTLGRRLLEGIKRVQIMNREFDVRARIESMDAFSAHAGKSEILEWLRAFGSFPGQVFLNHGEDHATEALAEAIRSEFGARVSIPKMNQGFNLD